jgi:hypothetical protein
MPAWARWSLRVLEIERQSAIHANPNPEGLGLAANRLDCTTQNATEQSKQRIVA